MEKKEFTINLVRSELVLHIRQIAYGLAKTEQPKEGELNDRTWMTDIFQGDNETGEEGQDTMLSELATREMTRSVHRLVNWMKENITGHVTQDEAKYDNQYRQPSEYHIHLMVDADYTSESGKYLVDAAHSAVVYDTLLKWCTLYAPQHAERLTVMKEQADEEMVDAVSNLQGGGVLQFPAYPAF